MDFDSVTWKVQEDAVQWAEDQGLQAEIAFKLTARTPVFFPLEESHDRA